MPPDMEIGIDDLPTQGVGGWMRVINRDKVNEVVSKIELAADREISWASGQERSRPASRAGSRAGSRPGSRAGSRAGSAKARTTVTMTSKQAAAHRAEQQRLLELRQEAFTAKLLKVKQQRDQDLHDLHEKVEEKKALREQRFERLVDEVYNSDLVGVTSRVLRKKDFEAYQKSSGLYDKWNKNVYSKIQKQLHRHINENVIRAVQPKQVAFKEPDQEASCTLRMEDDPLKQELRLQSEEDNIKRELYALARSRTVDVRAAVQDTGNVPDRARSRPVLEPSDWGQLRLQATGAGHMAQVSETPGETRTLRKFGHNVFVPDESDMIAAAGKRRTRWAWNDLGILKGDQAHRGQADGFKTPEGQSNGAPMQDHFQFETGTRVTDNEFPLGKKMYPHMH